ILVAEVSPCPLWWAISWFIKIRLSSWYIKSYHMATLHPLYLDMISYENWDNFFQIPIKIR
ncbi:MAG: hypothetical protein Q4C98_11695, partial [Capnocytophaga sp.]|nr:hypothetical protein [Capnocytophaga sp.]